jgi:hypothetical protein
VSELLEENNSEYDELVIKETAATSFVGQSRCCVSLNASSVQRLSSPAGGADTVSAVTSHKLGTL